MGGVDLLVQMVDHVAAERAFHKFWKRCFFAILDRIAYCAYVLYIKNTSTTRKLACIPLMCTLIEELCGQALELGSHQPLVPQGQYNLIQYNPLFTHATFRKNTSPLTHQGLARLCAWRINFKNVAL